MFTVTNQKSTTLAIGPYSLAPGQSLPLPGISPQILQTLKLAGDITFFGTDAADSFSGNNARTYSVSTKLNSSILASTNQDIFSITGSDSNTVYVSRITVSGVQTLAALNLDVSLVRRSTLNVGGTPTPLTPVQHDTLDIAATAKVWTFGSNSTAGTLVGTIREAGVSLVPAGGTAPPTIFSFGDAAKAVVLRSSSQQLCLNVNGITVAGSLFLSVEWFEI